MIKLFILCSIVGGSLSAITIILRKAERLYTKRGNLFIEADNGVMQLFCKECQQLLTVKRDKPLE